MHHEWIPAASRVKTVITSEYTIRSVFKGPVIVLTLDTVNEYLVTIDRTMQNIQ